MIKNIKYTPLKIASIAIRTCWQSFSKSDTMYLCPKCKDEVIASDIVAEKYYCEKCNILYSFRELLSFLGDNDKELVDRISNKYKHLSTIEHITIGFETSNQNIIDFFNKNKFSDVIDNLVITNLRVLMENRENKEVRNVINNLNTTDLKYLFNKNSENKKDSNAINYKNNVCLKTDKNDYVELLYTFSYGDYKKYTFSIKNISRALLQELARHRSANLSVKSTRYTLKELKEETDNLLIATNDDFLKKIAKRYIVFTDNEDINKILIEQLKNLKIALTLGVSNDIAKYALPECYKTDLIWSISEKDLENFLSLRDSKDALWEIRKLAQNIKKLDIIK